MSLEDRIGRLFVRNYRETDAEMQKEGDPLTVEEAVNSIAATAWVLLDMMYAYGHEDATKGKRVAPDLALEAVLDRYEQENQR